MFTATEIEAAIIAHDAKDSGGRPAWTAVPSALKRVASKASYDRRRASEALAAGLTVDQLRAAEERAALARESAANDAALARMNRESAALSSLRCVGVRRIAAMVAARLPAGLVIASERIGDLSGKSSYLTVADSDGCSVATIRISDHRQPTDGGYLVDNGCRAGASTASIDPTTFFGSVTASVDAAVEAVVASVLV